MSKSHKDTDRVYWRNLEELSDSPEYRKDLIDRYRQNDRNEPNSLTRRDFIALMGASMALAGLAGCRRPVEKIIPYVTQPEEIVPGVPQYYATTMPLGTSAFGLLVESHEGRPTKIEGNPKHPYSLGAVNAIVQASILGLYDPDRSEHVRHNRAESDWNEFVTNCAA